MTKHCIQRFTLTQQEPGGSGDAPTGRNSLQQSERLVAYTLSLVELKTMNLHLKPPVVLQDMPI